MWGKCLAVLECSTVSSNLNQGRPAICARRRRNKHNCFPREWLILMWFFFSFGFVFSYFSETANSSPKTMMETNLPLAGRRSNLQKSEGEFGAVRM